MIFNWINIEQSCQRIKAYSILFYEYDTSLARLTTLSTQPLRPVKAWSENQAHTVLSQTPPCGATTMTNMEKEVCQRYVHHMLVVEFFSKSSVPFPLRYSIVFGWEIVKIWSKIVVDIFILTMEEEGDWKGRKIVWKRYQEGGRGKIWVRFSLGTAELAGKLKQKSL